VAAEFDVQYYHNFDLTDSLKHQDGEMRGVTAGPNVKFYPLDWRVQPYALGGLGLLYMNDRGDLSAEDGLNFMLRAGGGLEETADGGAPLPRRGEG